MAGGTNPWLEVSSADYDRHMGHESVGQLSALSRITRDQFALVRGRAEPVVVILGIANGNGLECVEGEECGSIVGMDISQEFLDACGMRHSRLMSTLKLHQIDLMVEKQRAIGLMRGAHLIIANLLVEHIHLDNFMDIVGGSEGAIVSITIQVNPDGALVSRSGHEGVFEEVVEHARECDEGTLLRAMSSAGFSLMGRAEYGLPNGKSFVRLDLSRSR